MSDLEPITQEETAWANGDLEPITRKEQYLNRLTGEEQTIPETPITRTEQYLAKLCGMETEIPSSPVTREEAYLAYLNGENVTLPEPITRLEQFMAFAAEKSETKPTPLTREEFYWDKYQGGAVLKDFPGLPASIVTVTDAKAMPLDSLKVAITPVQSGSGDPSPDNIRPISGWTGCNMTRTGKNLCDPSLFNETYVTEADGVFTLSRNGYYLDLYSGQTGSGHVIPSNIMLPSLKAGTYVFSYKHLSGGTLSTIYFVDESGNRSELTQETTYDDDKVIIRFTMPTSGRITIVRIANTNPTTFKEPQIELGDTATAYEPYTGTTYPITFPSEAGTVYGGTLDVTNGTLTVTKANIASYDGETLPGVWISDRDVYVEGTTPTTGAQVVYDLDTPITYQLTPTDIQMLLGTNNLWADTGDVLDGKYYAKR